MAKRGAHKATKKGATKKPIESYDHQDKKRANNPPVGLVTPQTDPERGAKKTYQYDPHLDPQLVWAGKAEHTSFEVPTVSLHVHERIDPKTIIEAVRKRNRHPVMEQLSLFEQPDENPPLREAIEFYKHAHNWTNRMIGGVGPPVETRELGRTWTVAANGRSRIKVMTQHIVFPNIGTMGGSE